MILELHCYVTYSRQKVPDGLVVISSPLLLRVHLGCFLRRRVTCDVLRLSSVDYKVFFQLLRVDAMKFTLAENNGEMHRNISAI